MGHDGRLLPGALRSRRAPAEGPPGADPLRRVHRPRRQGVPAVEGCRETVLLRLEGVLLRDDGADRRHDEVQQHLQRSDHSGRLFSQRNVVLNRDVPTYVYVLKLDAPPSTSLNAMGTQWACQGPDIHRRLICGAAQ